MSFKKYPKIESLGNDANRDIFLYPEDQIVIEEKVDGGNGSFWLENDVIHYGSRNRDLTSEEDIKTFQKQRNYIMGILADKKLNPDYFYYVEWMTKHTINYTGAPDAIGIDIRIRHSANEEGFGLFLGKEIREAEFKRLGIANVNCVWTGQARDLRQIKLEDLVGKSAYYDGFMEGIVIKNYVRKATIGNHQIYAKIVRKEFKECNKTVFGNIRQKNSDTMKIVEEFCTNARIKKIIHKCVNEDNLPLDLKLMSKVPTGTIKDILEEEFGNIFKNYGFINFKEMKQLVAKNCLRVIREMMEDKT